MFLSTWGAVRLLTLCSTVIVFMVGFLADYLIYVGQYEHFGLFNSILEDEPWWQATQGLACAGFVFLFLAVGVVLLGICCDNCSRKCVTLMHAVLLMCAGITTGLGVIVFGVKLSDAYVIRSAVIALDFAYYLLVLSAVGFLLSALFALCDLSEKE